MEKSKQHPQPTQVEYCLVRDCLVTNSRAIIKYGTWRDNEKVKKENNQVVVEALKHKTMKYHGPASVVFSTTIQHK